jgi:hypothetical protein
LFGPRCGNCHLALDAADDTCPKCGLERAGESAAVVRTPWPTSRWLIIAAVVVGAIMLAIARLRWRYYDVPSTYRETCRAHDEVFNIAVFGFFGGSGLAVATLVFFIKRRLGCGADVWCGDGGVCVSNAAGPLCRGQRGQRTRLHL